MVQAEEEELVIISKIMLMTMMIMANWIGPKNRTVYLAQVCSYIIIAFIVVSTFPGRKMSLFDLSFFLETKIALVPLELCAFENE